jgi:ABC-2 type transport system ATP-binding protein
LPETVPLYTDLTPYDYLEFVAKLKGIPRAEREERIDEVVETCRMGDVVDKLIGKLSKGYRQRVGIAQALLHAPEVLILDEPTVGLDPKQIIETRELIKSLGGERSIILSTHILPEVSMTCNRVVIINEGQVVAEDTPENLTRRLRGSEHIYLEVAGPADAVSAKLKGLEHVLHVAQETSEPPVGKFVVESVLGRDVRARLAAAVVESGWDLLEMRPVSMSLEEIFLKLTTKEEENA